jgi:ADP-heptose:LPS heptosyltransferase
LGWGDWLMATAEVKRAYEKTGKPVCVGDGSKAEWNDVFINNPKIAKEPYLGVSWVRSFKGYRRYIKAVTEEKLIYDQDFKAEPGEIFLTDEEKNRYEDLKPFILIEPNTKSFPISKNKRWPIQKWQQVVDELKDEFKFIQPLTGKYKIQGIPNVGTRDFRDGVALMNQSDLLVTTDGGLHHAAAALGKKAVVIWGGLTSPKNLGYDFHINLHAGSQPCGSKVPCAHCLFELEKITPEMVVKAIRSVFGEERRAAGVGAGSEDIKAA